MSVGLASSATMTSGPKGFPLSTPARSREASIASRPCRYAPVGSVPTKSTPSPAGGVDLLAGGDGREEVPASDDVLLLPVLTGRLGHR